MVLMNQDDVDYYVDSANDRCWHLISQKEGHYFKIQGLSGTEGPYGDGSFVYLSLYLP